METSDTAKPHSTVDELLQEAIDELRKDENIDVALLEILVRHIIVESPADTAIANAVRLIIRRVQPTPGSQLALFATYSYHGFIKQIETLATERAEGN